MIRLSLFDIIELKYVLLSSIMLIKVSADKATNELLDIVIKFISILFFKVKKVDKVNSNLLPFL